MSFQIVDYLNTVEEDNEITSLLTHAYVNDEYTDKSYAEKMFVPAYSNMAAVKRYTLRLYTIQYRYTGLYRACTDSFFA